MTIANTLQTKYQDKQIPDGYTVSPTKQNAFVGILLSLLPFVLIVVVFLFLMNQMQGGGSRVMNFGKSKAKRRPESCGRWPSPALRARRNCPTFRRWPRPDCRAMR